MDWLAANSFASIEQGLVNPQDQTNMGMNSKAAATSGSAITLIKNAL